MASLSNLPRSIKVTDSLHEQVTTMPTEPAASAGTFVLHHPGTSFHGNLEGELETDPSKIEATPQADPSKGKAPIIGMKFNSEQEAYDFYNAYARDMGFSIRRSSYHYVKDSTIIKNRTFCCSRAGTRGHDKREDQISNYGQCFSRPETRCMCRACMKISLRDDGLYCIYEFLHEHNHILATGSQALYLRSQRKITEAQMASAENAKSVGISNKATIDLMAKEAGGYENLGFTREDMKNILYSKRSLKRKLNDGRPFGLLVGVDNHKKSVVFGAALLYDETADSFVWLFKTFLKAMSGKKPQTILTDEDAAMAKAIKLVMPESHHRICVWHMNQNACKHLAGVVKEYKKFNADFQNCIYDKEEEDEFINAWNRMLKKYDLQENKWLERLFQKKEQWALVYGRNTFSADMSGTQRSESMNNELKGYISVKYDILTFLEHFDRLLSDKRYEEVKNDFKTTQSTPWPKVDLTILRQATRIYTPAIFKVFQEQVLQTLNCDLYYCGDIDAEMYKLKVHESDETYLMAANNAQKLAEDVEKYLSIRPDPDLDKSGTEENVGPSKARGIKVKEKAIRGSRRPIGGFDKATQWSKKKKSDSSTSKCPVQAEVVTPSLPYTMMQIQGRSEIPTNYNHMQMPDYYHVEGASLLQSSGYFELLNKVKGCSMKRLHRHLIHIPIACLPI
uniref:Transposon protein, putative, unclassified n=1 Tax=Oryza sativa subsp. japonica TaxID=39947 RepID=Q2R8S0_ORYSJ|nr:transposon protein, putative, unclassified [Oryza sativa Japonica Group]